jgi:hypothetical protein
MRTKLSPTFVASATAVTGAERSIYWDDDLPGFGLQVTATGHKSFVCIPRRKAKTKATTLSDWKTRPPSLATVQAKRQKLWDAVNEYVRESGGWITSVPGVSLIRIEAPQGSALPSKLTALGYTVVHCGSGTRLTPSGTVETIGTRSAPIIRHHAGFVPIEILEISLPGA